MTDEPRVTAGDRMEGKEIDLQARSPNLVALRDLAGSLLERGFISCSIYSDKEGRLD